MAVRARLVQGAADQVVGFVVRMRRRHQSERVAQRAAVGELALELRRRRVAVGLVGRVQRVAEAAVERFVEGDDDVFRAFAFEQFEQETGEAVHRVGRPAVGVVELVGHRMRSEEHTSELQSLMRISYAVFCLKKKTNRHSNQHIKKYNKSSNYILLTQITAPRQ